MGAAVTPSPGDIGLVRIHGAAGVGIRAAQWANGDGFADYEHAFGMVDAETLLEAEPGGSRLRPLSRYAGEPIMWLRCPDRSAAEVATAYRGLVDVPYSLLDYGALALHRLHIPAPGLRAYIQDSGHAICSQLVDEGARRGGWQLFDDQRWEGYCTPGALRRLAANQKEQP
jgi:hypothetical protein